MSSRQRIESVLVNDRVLLGTTSTGDLTVALVDTPTNPFLVVSSNSSGSSATTYVTPVTALQFNPNITQGTGAVGTTGTIRHWMPFAGASYKKAIVHCITYAGPIQTYTFSTAFSVAPLLVMSTLTPGTLFSFTTTGFTIISPNSGADAVSGFVIFEGY